MDIRKLLEKMTFEEKTFQLIQLNSMFFKQIGASDATGPMEDLQLDNEGIKYVGTTLNSMGAARMKEIQDEYMQNHPNKIPMIFMQDVVHGYRTIYPIPLGLACSFDMELIKDCSAMAAKEASVDGVQLTFAPMVDLVRDARWGRVMESTGEDPYLNCLASKAQVEGYQGDGGKYTLAACVKHFAAYGAAEAGRDYNTVDMSERTLREYYLPAYKAAVDAGVESVMTAFNTVDGIPAVGNKWLVDTVLRKEWKYDGVVISDYNAFRELIVHGAAEDEKQAACMAMNASVDIEMMSATYPKYLKELLAEGKVTMEQIDTAVLRVLRLKEKLGLFDNPYADSNEEEAAKFILCDEHRALAAKAAEQSAVLLKNNGVLPFKKTIKKIAVIGPLGDTGEIIGFWQCGGEAKDSVSIATGLKRKLGESKVFVEMGCDVALNAKCDVKRIKAAKKLAKKCDAVVLCLGEHEHDSGEGNSKLHLDLPEVQYKLLQEVLSVNKNTAVLLFTGRPLTVKRLHEQAPAILNMWFPGTEGGTAAANLLFGDVCPSGKLTMTFPQYVGQCPIYYNAYNTGRPRYNEKERVGYCSSYIDGGNRPLYPFGYGLSYVDFEYSEPTLSATKMQRGERIIASVKVKNKGFYEAQETVQLYIRDLYGSTVRPVKELKGFKKISLLPNEEKVVAFDIDEESLAFYGSDLKRKAESGKFAVFIGASSDCQPFAEFELL